MPSQQRAARALREPHPDCLAPDHPRRQEMLAAHDAALASAGDGYIDPVTGLLVSSAS